MNRSKKRTSSEPPLNNETPNKALVHRITPSEKFYTRSHFELPKVSEKDWKLSVEMESKQLGSATFESCSFQLSDLRKMKQKKIVATLECAGNSRSGFSRVAEGEIRWGEGAVGTASWSGVPLGDLLNEKFKISDDASVVYFEGLDQKKDGGKIASAENEMKFVRYLPIEKALDENTIIALKMNGEFLSPVHGYPCRLVVPGWYAMASVKWLSRIHVSSEQKPFSYFNDVKYVYRTGTRKGTDIVTPVREMRVKSIISSPLEGERLSMDRNVTLRGKAWSGSGRIARVEFRTSDDPNWIDSKIEQDLGQFGWASWSGEWRPTNSGEVIISVRATDEKGNCQPVKPFENVFQYGCNATSSRRVIVSDVS